MEPTHQPLSQRTWNMLVLGVLISLGMAGWFQLIRDEPPQMPPGYVLPDFPPPVSDADNGLVYLYDEVEKEAWPKVESGPGGHSAILHWREPWDAERMQPLLDAAPAMREIVEKALGYPGWRNEVGPGTRPLYDPTFLAQNLFLSKVRQCLEADDAGEAMDWLEPVFRLSRRQEQTPISVSDVMIGAGTSRVASATLMRVVARSRADDGILARGLTMLDFPTARREDLLLGLALDYRRNTALWFDPTKDPKLKLGALFGMFHGKEVPEWLIRSRFKPQAYHNLLLRNLALLERLSKDTGRDGLQELREARDWLEAESKLSVWSLDPNRAGRILTATDRVYFQIAENLLASDAYRQCCRVAIASKRWSLAHEGLRLTSLTDLVPGYLPALPMDPYDDRPLKWDTATGTVYMIGPDGVDNLPDFKPGEVSASGDKGVGVRLP